MLDLLINDTLFFTTSYIVDTVVFGKEKDENRYKIKFVPENYVKFTI